MPSRAEQQARDAEIVADKALGLSWDALAKKHKVSTDTCRRAWNAWWENNKPEMNRNPLDVVQEAIARYEELMSHFAVISKEAPDANNKIGAGKAVMEAQTRMLELMQATGLLPKHLGTLRYITDVRVIVQVVTEVFKEDDVPLATAEKIAQRLEQRAAMN